MTDLATSSAPLLAVNPPDADPQETREWLDAFDALVHSEGRERATFLCASCSSMRARACPAPVLNTPYKNSWRLRISLNSRNLELESRISAIVRWNALAMVVARTARTRARRHIASYASRRPLRRRLQPFLPSERPGLFPAPFAPGVYARAFLEGRLPEERLAHYARKPGGKGVRLVLPPYLMPEFAIPAGRWALAAQRVTSALHALSSTGILRRGRKVWEFVGDGEMDERSRSAGCRSRRGKGSTPDLSSSTATCSGSTAVRGNGSSCRSWKASSPARWNSPVLWGSDWDRFFARDRRVLLNGCMRRWTESSRCTRRPTGASPRGFLSQVPKLTELIANMSDEDIDRLHRGGQTR